VLGASAGIALTTIVVTLNRLTSRIATARIPGGQKPKARMGSRGTRSRAMRTYFRRRLWLAEFPASLPADQFGG
jgi:hypothetical protein